MTIFRSIFQDLRSAVDWVHIDVSFIRKERIINRFNLNLSQNNLKKSL